MIHNQWRLTRRAADWAVRGAFFERILNEEYFPFRELVLTAQPLTQTVGRFEEITLQNPKPANGVFMQKYGVNGKEPAVKTLHLLVTTFFLLVVPTSCANMLTTTQTSKPIVTPASMQTLRPTKVAIPTDLAFSGPVVEVLSQSGLSIVLVQSSTYMAMFQSTDQAVWIKTNEGIVEAVFFTDPAEVKQIHITEQPNKTAGRYLYTIQAPAPTLLHGQTIDAAYPLYFTIKNDMLLITSSEELDKTLKHIPSGQ